MSFITANECVIDDFWFSWCWNLAAQPPDHGNCGWSVAALLLLPPPSIFCWVSTSLGMFSMDQPCAATTDAERERWSWSGWYRGNIKRDRKTSTVLYLLYCSCHHQRSMIRWAPALRLSLDMNYQWFGLYVGLVHWTWFLQTQTDRGPWGTGCVGGPSLLERMTLSKHYCSPWSCLILQLTVTLIRRRVLFVEESWPLLVFPWKRGVLNVQMWVIHPGLSRSTQCPFSASWSLGRDYILFIASSPKLKLIDRYVVHYKAKTTNRWHSIRNDQNDVSVAKGALRSLILSVKLCFWSVSFVHFCAKWDMWLYGAFKRLASGGFLSPRHPSGTWRGISVAMPKCRSGYSTN